MDVVRRNPYRLRLPVYRHSRDLFDKRKSLPFFHGRLSRFGLTKDAQQEAGGDGGTDDAGHVGTHGVHQQ